MKSLFINKQLNIIDMKMDPITHKLFVVGHKGCLIFDTLVRFVSFIPLTNDLLFDYVVESRIRLCSLGPQCIRDQVSESKRRGRSNETMIVRPFQREHLRVFNHHGIR